MRRIMVFAVPLLLLALFDPVPASAWTVQTAIQPRQTVAYDFTGTADSPMLTGEACSSVLFSLDQNAIGTAQEAQAEILGCPSPSSLAAACDPVATLSVDEQVVLVSRKPSYFLVSPVAGPGAATTARVTAYCSDNQSASTASGSADLAFDPAGTDLESVTIPTAIAELDGKKLNVSDASVTLIGGDGAIPNPQDPNDENANGTYDDPLDCPADSGVCAYFNAFSGWWLSSVSSAVWLPVAEQLVYSFTVFENANWVGAIGTSSCLDFGAGTNQNPTAKVACNGRFARLIFGRPLLVTSFSVTVTDTVVTSQGCRIALTRNNGAIDIATLTIPSAQSTTAALGASFEQRLTNLLSSSTNLGIKIGDGPNCGNGSACTCNTTSGLGFQIRVFGIVNLP